MAPSGPGRAPAGKHEWNSFENYRELHERYLETHPCIEDHNVKIELFDFAGRAQVAVSGTIRCRGGIVLEVEKYAEAELRGRRNPRLWVRTYSFRYNAYLPGKHSVLRYDNNHDFDEYHRHPYDPATGTLGPVAIITRADMPHLSQVLDEILDLFG